MQNQTNDVTTEEYFGGCPKCGQNDGYRNVGRDHWFACHTHKTKWCGGANLFSCWHSETKEIWERNHNELLGYEDVKPIYPPDTRTPAEIERAARFVKDKTINTLEEMRADMAALIDSIVKQKEGLTA